MRIFPIDGECFVDLNVLARLHAPAAKHALIRIVYIKRVRSVDFVRLGLERDFLMFDLQHLGRVVNGAIPVVVVANRTIQHVVSEYPIERLALRGICPDGLRLNCHPIADGGCARSDQFPVHLGQTSVTAFDWAKLMMITDRRNLYAAPNQEVDEEFGLFHLHSSPVQR
jgi:hypothetical protein